MSSIRIPVEDSIISKESFKIPYSWLVPVRKWIQSSTSDRSWYKILAITGTASGAVVVTYYIVKKCTSSRPETRKCESNGSAKTNGSLVPVGAAPLSATLEATLLAPLSSSVSAPLSLSVSAPLSLSPVKSKARKEFEYDVIDGPPSEAGMLNNSSAEDAEDGHLNTPRVGGTSFRRRNRSDSLTSGTTLMLTSRDPSQLLLYGLESLKRSIRLWEEARNKLVMGNDGKKFSFEQSIDPFP